MISLAREMSYDTFLPQVPSVKIGVGNLAVRCLKKASQWAIIFLGGYYTLSPGLAVGTSLFFCFKVVLCWEPLWSIVSSSSKGTSGRRKRNSESPQLKQQLKQVKKK